MVVSSFTAPINAFVDVLFENILMAPTSEGNDKSRNKNNVLPEPRSIGRTEILRRPALLKSASSKILFNDFKQKRDIPEETALAHGRATMLASKTVSKIAASRRLGSTVSEAATEEDDLDSLFSKFMEDLEGQRKSLTRREHISFDKSWR